MHMNLLEAVMEGIKSKFCLEDIRITTDHARPQNRLLLPA